MTTEPSSGLDARAGAARFYDLSPPVFDDIPFYRERLRSPHARVLELGCGTGRVTLPLAEACGLVHGVDGSAAMLAICHAKLAARPDLVERVELTEADITDLSLPASFDLIIAPFRVMQNLETDAELAGLFASIHRHLAEGGRAILNAFHPMYDPEEMRRSWIRDHETLEWEGKMEGDTVTIHDRRERMDLDRLVLYPEMVYRRYRGGRMTEEVVLPLVMRCFYPAELIAMVEGAGFRITERWGGYAGEPYGCGKELVVELGARSQGGIAGDG